MRMRWRIYTQILIPEIGIIDDTKSHDSLGSDQQMGAERVAKDNCAPFCILLRLVPDLDGIIRWVFH